MATAPTWRHNIGLWLLVLRVLSTLCVLVGVIWLFMLPLNEYSRGTYISENALLPGQVHTYFGGSEQNVYRAYKIEVERLSVLQGDEKTERLVSILKDAGLKVGTQKYKYTTAGEVHMGENVYAILHAPRGDATEAIVLCAPFLNINQELNKGGVALVISLARYFKRWSIWSKDIIILITSDARAGTQAWVDAYHDTHKSADIASLPHTSGAIQGVVVVDFPQNIERFEALHVVYDGINGQLPNLDLINTAVQIASGQMGIRTTFQEMWQHDDTYAHRLRTMLRGMVNQGLGHSSGAHSSFLPYHIDAITLQAYGEGWHDEMALGRTIESLFRSLNNLLEHFHQSFFFYLLMAPRRFVSIGTYLPSAMLVAVGFTLTAIRLWIDSGRNPEAERMEEEKEPLLDRDGDLLVEEKGKEEVLGDIGTIQPQDLGLSIEKSGNWTDAAKDAIDGMSILTAEPLPLPPSKRERHPFLPIIVVLGAHFFGVIPLAIFNSVNVTAMTTGFYTFFGLSIILPFLLVALVTNITTSSDLPQLFQLTKCFSLLILGMILAALATLNFSLSFLIGLSALPLSFAKPFPNTPVFAALMTVILQVMSPFTALMGASLVWKYPLDGILREAAFAWGVMGMWTPVVIWVVWYPAWLLGSMSVNASWWLIYVEGLRGGEVKGLERLRELQGPSNDDIGVGVGMGKEGEEWR